MPKDDTKHRIIRAARDCFAQFGWQGTTTQKIAQVADVNEVTLFRHFGSKNELFAQMVGCYITAQREVLSRTIEQNASFEETLTRYAEVYYRTVGGNPDYVRTMLGEMSRHPTEVRQVVIDMMRPMREQFLQFLTERQRRNEIRADIQCEAVMDAFMGLLFANIVKPRFNDPSYTQEEYIRFAVGLFIRGLKP